MRYLLIFILIFPLTLVGQELWKWRTTDDFTIGDRIAYYPDAYVLHTVANIYMVKKFQDYGMNWWQADLTTFGIGVLWEVKDGFIPYEKVDYLGGDGFSTTDIAVNSIIIVGNRLVRTAFGYFFPRRRYSVAVTFNYIPY
ncbi:MAG: hypothetical protein JXQ65_08325 [Candidatus Marinimicrobia bacterium]|nr:hypothetical protein [Candidatus Neomarinimicrobiota bacterium]